MTPFAAFFMAISMFSVTLLAGFCIYRVLTAPPPEGDEDPSD